MRCAGKAVRVLVLTTAMLSGCSRERDQVTLEFWAMGREGEVVQALMPEFEREHPGVRVKVQQIPWSAAHEKLLTAFAGNSMPDVFQLGNTWIPEFVVLNAVEPLDTHLTAGRNIQREDYFAGILATNEIDGRLYGLPWYVDTRILFYRKDILAEAGFAKPPRTWKEWTEAMAAIKALPGGEHYAILLPMNEWQMPVILGLQLGADLLRDAGRYGDFRGEPFRRAFSFYIELFRKHYAPAVAEAQIANVYQEFARGYFAFYVTGPWNIGEFQRRLPGSVQGKWGTAPMPLPENLISPHPGPRPEGEEVNPGISLAGGASLALARSSKYKDLAFDLIEFLSSPARQIAFYRLAGDLPARRSAWENPELADADHARAFRIQLEQVVPTPKVPEWERIASKLAYYAEKTVRGEMTEDEAVANLDADVDAILEKRRWLMEKEARSMDSSDRDPLSRRKGTGMTLR